MSLQDDGQTRLAELEQFATDGVLVLRGFFGAQEAGLMQAAWRELAPATGAAGLSRVRRFVFGSMPGPIAVIYRHPALVRLMTAMLGKDLALYMNRLLLKDAVWADAVELHQDMPYLHGTQRKISVFVPLLPALSRNGGLRYALGTHHHGLLQPGPIDRAVFPAFVELAPDLGVGDIVLVDSLTWHWSEAAEVREERPLLQIMYQSASDGSYGGAAFGVAEPTLISGAWRTGTFSALRSEEKRVGSDPLGRG